MIRTYYKDGVFWRTISPNWEIKLYGTAIDGKGDLIFNTLLKIGVKDELSLQDYVSIDKCSILLKEGRRWPIRMDQWCDSKGHIEYYWNRFIYWLSHHKKEDHKTEPNWLGSLLHMIHRKYRPADDMTRDPHIAYYWICLKRDVEIDWGVKIPWWLYSPQTWAWRKYIRTHKHKYLRRFNFWFRFKSKHGYVQQLDEMMEDVI